MTTNNQIPRLSLLSYVNGGSTDRAMFAQDLLTALKTYGFFVLTNHSIEQAKNSGALAATRRFFELPAEIKLRYRIPGANGQRGYTGFGVDQAIQQYAPDHKEYWHMGREALSDKHATVPEMRNVWPAEAREFRAALLNLFNSLDEVGNLLLLALAEALGLSEDYFSKLTNEGNCVLRCLHYPPLPKLDPEGTSFRAAPHKDINLFTLLVAEERRGLQFRDKDGTWLNVAAETGEMVVDSGEMLSLITNDLIQATTHRVIQPKDQNSSRYSMVFLVHPNADAKLVCIDSCKAAGEKYVPVSAHDFLMSRIEYWKRTFTLEPLSKTYDANSHELPSASN